MKSRLWVDRVFRATRSPAPTSGLQADDGIEVTAITVRISDGTERILRLYDWDITLDGVPLIEILQTGCDPHFWKEY